MTDSSISYQGDGRTTAFPVPFSVFGEADVEVRVDGARQTLGIKVAGGVGGGMVIFTKAPAAGAAVVLRRLLEVAQVPSFESGGTLSAKALRLEFERLGAAIEQVAEDVGRAVVRSPLSFSTADLTLPDPIPGRALAWNMEGTGLANSGANIEEAERQAAAHAAKASGFAVKAAVAATDSARAADEAKEAEAQFRVVAEEATRTITAAADMSMVEAQKAALLVSSVADPAAAYRRQKLLGLW